jgi:Leucine-rich repeat (LRR) protein
MRLLRNNWLLLSSLAVVFTAAASCRGAGFLPDDDSARHKTWIKQNLTANEAAQLEQLATEITSGPGEPAQASRALRDRVRALSIRQAAGLGTFLLGKDKHDPRPWLSLAQQREKQAIAQLIQVQRGVGLSEPGYEPIQKTVRGPVELREYCGDELLSEVTTVGFWNFYDGGIPAPSSFRDEDVEFVVALPGIEVVIAPWSELSDEGALRLASMPRLRELHISGAYVSDIVLEKLSENPRMRAIDVSQTECISDVGIGLLEKCPRLELLNLSETGITSVSLSTISRLRELQELWLSSTLIREDLGQLGRLKNLRILALNNLGSDDHPLRSEELEFLSGLKQLTSLSLAYTSVKRLVVRDLPNLLTLRLGHSRLSDLTLVKLPGVRELRILANYGADPLKLEHLSIRGIPKLNWIAIQGLSPAAADGLARGLSGMPMVQSCYLNSSISDNLAVALGKLERLNNLSIKRCELTDLQLAAISPAPALSFLTVGGTSLTSAGLSKLHRSPKLERLQLEDLKLESADFLADIAGVGYLRMDRCQVGKIVLVADTALHLLELNQATIGDLIAKDLPRFQHISTSGSKVTNLVVESCPRFGHLFFGSATIVGRFRIAHCGNLNSITFYEGSDPGELTLENLTALKTVSYWAADVNKQHLEALVGLPVLTHLEISGTPLDDDAAQVIPRLSTLTELRASSHFSLEGLKQIGQLPSLQRLDLYHTDESDWTPEQAKLMFSSIRDVTVW